MCLLLPSSSIACGPVQLNYLAWGLRLRFLIRKLWPWCSCYLIENQLNILYACIHGTPLHLLSLHTFTQSPHMELAHILLLLSGFKSNLKPKFRLVKPFPWAFASTSLEECAVILRSSCLIQAIVSGVIKKSQYNSVKSCSSLSNHRGLASRSKSTISCRLMRMWLDMLVLGEILLIWFESSTTTTQFNII